ncbi:hypothetical protein FRUB_02826 [Fimbriiglobus ruber]|uniref:Uncharacterized protein n=1 Tax=Fimbriiglobus ruber TaxID=1908690 RepID=A0A225E489_9BACT|nr:hypothetical protein FRUB_02826 [Fimbriiglobus ruber]
MAFEQATIGMGGEMGGRTMREVVGILNACLTTFAESAREP